MSKTLPGHVAELVEVFAGLTRDEQAQLEALCRKLGLWAAAKAT